MTENQNKDNAVIPSQWAKSLKIPETAIQEVKLYSNLGWAMDAYGKPRQLSIDEQKMMALATYKLGFSAMGKQLIFLGNSLYVTKGGKIAVARKDEKMPMTRVKVRPATSDERVAYGILHNEPEEQANYEHLWYAEIFARIDGETVSVSDAYGHACVSNIKLYGKEKDPRRLCADMASTRAISRALSQAYDFFGIDSFEEVAMMPDNNKTEPIDVSADVTTVEPEGNAVKDVLKFMDDNAKYLPSEIFQKFNKERLGDYTDDALAKTYETIKAQVEANKKEIDDQQRDLGIPETKPEGGTPEKAPPKKTKKKNVS